MRKQGFTLSELLVGVVIGLLLTTAMLSFTSTIVFDFHAQKDMVNDRTVLKQIMNGISEDMVQVGFDASADGQITLEASSEAFIEVGEEQLGYWVPTASIDVVTSDQPGLDLGWQKVSWTIENFKDPITLEEIPCLVRTIEDADKVVLSQEPVLTRVESFIPEIGLSDGTFITNLDDVTNFPKIRSVRIRLRSKTLNNTTAPNPGSDELIEQESTQIYFFEESDNMRNKRGISLVIAVGMVLVLFMLSLVSLSTLRSNTTMRGNMYVKAVAEKASTSGVHRASPELIADASNNFMNVLIPGYKNEPDQDIAYTLNTFSATYTVTLEDNDDLDDNFEVDTDKRLIINSTGKMVDQVIVLGQTQMRVLARYTGASDEYAQATGTSKGNSSFLSEINIGEDMNVDASADPNQ